LAATGPVRGLVTGYVFKLARESTGRSQESLALTLGVDRATVQGWETARRPFTAVPVGQAVSLRHRLTLLGAQPQLVALLTDATEADYLLGQIIDIQQAGTDLTAHPLAHTVLTHTLSELLAWTVTGRTPQPVSVLATPAPTRRGPTADGPRLTAEQHGRFFAGLQYLAECSSGRFDGPALLLHRQACYLAGLDPTGDTRAWLGAAAVPGLSARQCSWTPRWADARSVATALARQGDPEPLRRFIDGGNGDTRCELAHLNYSAYWVGEIAERQHRDDFMVAAPAPWRGTRLLAHLTERLTSRHGFIDLSVHTLWLLMAQRPGLARDDPRLTRTLEHRGEQLLDEATISQQSRRELISILYSLRAMG
jgi:hypothetical protein